MAAVKTEQQWNGKEVNERLESLYEKDNLWPAVLAARAALRVFPLIGHEEHFNFWINVDHNLAKAQSQMKKQNRGTEVEGGSLLGKDNRARFLLASFVASRLILQQAILPAEQRQFEKLAASAAGAEAADAHCNDEVIYYAVMYAVNSAANAAAEAIYFDSGHTGNYAYTANAAATAAASAAEEAANVGGAAEEAANVGGAAEEAANVGGAAAEAYIKGNASAISKAFLMDLKTAETTGSINSVVESALWPESSAEILETVKYKEFQSAVKALIGEISDSNPESAKALAQVLVLYDGYLSGCANLDKDNTSEEPLYEAISKITAEDVNATKDALNRSSLVRGLTGILCNDEHTHPLTIGLMGNWGSGKTQVLELLKRELKSCECKQPFLFGEFNAWAYEHSKSIQAAMAHEVISALTSCDRLKTVDSESNLIERLLGSMSNLFQQLLWTMSGRTRLIIGFAMRKHFGKVLQSAFWLLLFIIASWVLAGSGLSQNQLPDFSKPSTSGALIAFGASIWQLIKLTRDIISQPMTKHFLTYIKLPNYAAHIGEITEMKKDIRIIANLRLGFMEELCHDYVAKISNSRRLLFVVDDLDRCSPNGIVKTFEAIRLVLNIPQVTVVVAVDQRIALAALAHHYKNIEQYHTLQDARAIARDYLAKMIQLPVVVSDGDDESLADYLSDIWLEEGNSKNNWLAHLVEDEERGEQNIHASSTTLNESETPELQKHDIDSNSGREGMAESELVKLILEGEPTPQLSKPEILRGLKDHQKAALYYWATHFGLSNARQLKRLDNSYNLIRLVTDQEDKIALTQANNNVNKQHIKFSYGYLVTLMTLEFINSIEVRTLRENASRFLRRGDVNKLNSMANDDHKTTLMAARFIIQHAAEQLYPQIDRELTLDRLLSYVENFVLPAIDGFDVDTETGSSAPVG